ncbi:MAG: nuclear transport factor 2 family protein [Actinobacteria bacterium]|nr:MAG: nuclear transport factor 2 family protein [Actinomycetota bacterium]
MRKALPEARREFLEEAFAPDLEWIPYMGVVEGKVYRGRDALDLWLADMLEAFEEVHPEVQTIRDLDDYVLVTGRTMLRGRASQVGADFNWVQLFCFRGGRVAWIRSYRDEGAAPGDVAGSP